MTRASGREPVLIDSDGAGGDSARTLIAALAAGDLDRADAAAERIGPVNELDAATLAALADLHLKRRRWSRAVDALESIEERGSGLETQLRLARNFDALEHHRADVYRRLMTLTKPASVCQPGLSPRGEPTLVQTLPEGHPVVLTPGGEPSVALPQIVAGLDKDIAQGRSLVLCGVGDGYLITHLSTHSPTLPLGQQQCVHIVEPYPEVMLAAMMIHDWSVPDGPIMAPRFHWWIGETWANDLHAALEHDPYLPLPERPVRMSIEPDELDARLREVIEALGESERRLAERVARRYAKMTAESLAPLFGADPPRQPRVLLLTTRFSTVLQYSTRDLAAAFEEAGWATRIPIEPGAAHRNSRRNLLRLLADFQPDLVVQIDHLRHEHRGLFPPELPFVCWIQDDLPNLTTRAAGAAVQSRDFVLTSAPQIYVNDYGYPPRQCITFAKRTQVASPATSHGRSWKHDLAFVSNASQVPEALADQLATDFGKQDKALGQVVRAVCERILSRYRQGRCLETLSQVQGILAEEAMQRGGAWSDPDLPLRIAGRLFSSLNNALYRQQSLQWVKEAVEEHELDFGLYGSGWEQHPQFKSFARGSIGYGQPLVELTAGTRINLQIVPYSCMHQRLLDGVAAGGFFLIREHPVDRLTLDFKAIMQQAADEDGAAESVDELRTVLGDETRRALDDWLIRRAAAVDHRGTDPVANYRAAQREGREHLYDVLPRYDEVVFSTREDLARLVCAFIEDPGSREHIAKHQWAFIEQHYTYRGGVDQLTRVVADRLQAESALTLVSADGEMPE